MYLVTPKYYSAILFYVRKILGLKRPFNFRLKSYNIANNFSETYKCHDTIDIRFSIFELPLITTRN